MVHRSVSRSLCVSLTGFVHGGRELVQCGQRLLYSAILGPERFAAAAELLVPVPAVWQPNPVPQCGEQLCRVEASQLHCRVAE